MPGLLRADHSKTAAWAEVERVIKEVKDLQLDSDDKTPAAVAIVTSAESFWVSDIERQGAAYRYDDVQFDYYRALRSIGVSVDFVDQSADLGAYRLIVAPGLPIIVDTFIERCKQSDASIVFGPRSGAKTAEFSCPAGLPPGPIQSLLPARVLSVETLREDCVETLSWNDRQYVSRVWREEIDAVDADVLATYDDGSAAVVRRGAVTYLATLTNNEFPARPVPRIVCRARHRARTRPMMRCVLCDAAHWYLRSTTRIRRRQSRRIRMLKFCLGSRCWHRSTLPSGAPSQTSAISESA